MSDDASPCYVDPATGVEHELDAVQLEIYHELITEHGLHPRDAIIVAFLLDAVEAEDRIVDWSKILLGSTEASRIANLARSYLSTASRMSDRPDLWPTIKISMGQTQNFRLWTIGRMRWLASRN